MEILQRELIYFWYYFSVQLEQIIGYWVLGMLIGSAVSVFAKDYIHPGVPLSAGERDWESQVSLRPVASESLRPSACTAQFPIAASFSKGESGMTGWRRL